MNIQDIFSTKERLKILESALYKEGALSVNKMANELKLSKGLVSKFFGILAKERIVRRKGKKALLLDNVKTRAIKILLNLDSFDTRLFNKYKFVKSAGIYGSFVKGKNTKESDIDLWVLIDNVKEEILAKLTNDLKRRYDNIKPLYLTKEKLKLLKREDAVFYYSLVFGSISIYGGEIEEV